MLREGKNDERENKKTPVKAHYWLQVAEILEFTPQHKAFTNMKMQW